MSKFDNIIAAKVLEYELSKYDISNLLTEEEFTSLTNYILELKTNETIDEGLKSAALGTIAALGIGGAASYGATKNIDASQIKHANYVQSITNKNNIKKTEIQATKVKSQLDNNTNKITTTKPSTNTIIKIKPIDTFPKSPSMCGNSVNNIINLINSHDILKKEVYRNGVWDFKIIPDVIVTLVCEVGPEYNGTPERANVYKVIKGRIKNKGFKQGKLYNTRDVVLHLEYNTKAFSFWSDENNHNFSIFNNYEKLKNEFENNKNFSNAIIDAIKIQTRDYVVTENTPVFYETHKSANNWTKAKGKGNRFTSKYYTAIPVDVGTSPHIFYKLQQVKTSKSKATKKYITKK